jgi:hypothetical protein
MKFLDVKLVSQFLLHFGSQFPEMFRADFVGRGLTWPRDVAFDLILCQFFADRRILQKIISGLLERPTQGIDSRVNNTPTGSK